MSTDKKKANVNTGNLTRWLTTQRYIRIGHNKQVKAYFKTSSKGSTRERLRNTLLMYKEDSAQQILVKMQYFQQYLSGVKTLTSPIIFEIITMNSDFFRRGMEKIGIKAKKIEEVAPPILAGESSFKP